MTPEEHEKKLNEIIEDQDLIFDQFSRLRREMAVQNILNFVFIIGIIATFFIK